MSTKAARGTKRTCQSCDSRFYDLNREPITCPMCGAVFQREAHDIKAERELRIAADEAEVKASKAAAAKELAATTEVAEGEELAEISTEELAEIEADADTEVAPDGEDETFLEQEEDDGSVDDLIDNPIEGDEDEA